MKCEACGKEGTPDIRATGGHAGHGQLTASGSPPSAAAAKSDAFAELRGRRPGLCASSMRHSRAHVPQSAALNEAQNRGKPSNAPVPIA